MSYNKPKEGVNAATSKYDANFYPPPPPLIDTPIGKD
jgi:hypothetical protein